MNKAVLYMGRENFGDSNLENFDRYQLSIDGKRIRTREYIWLGNSKSQFPLIAEAIGAYLFDRGIPSQSFSINNGFIFRGLRLAKVGEIEGDTKKLHEKINNKLTELTQRN